MTITVDLDFGKGEFGNFEECIRNIYRAVLQAGREITTQVLEAMDDELLDSRDASRFRCREFQPTGMKTMMGPVIDILPINA